MSDNNDDDDDAHSDSSAGSSAASGSKSKTSDGQRLDVDHMYSDQSQDGQMCSRNTVIRDIVKVNTSQSHHHHHHHYLFNQLYHVLVAFAHVMLNKFSVFVKMMIIIITIIILLLLLCNMRYTGEL